MDMTKEAFRYYLPWILHELTTCCFVSLDLELSGIPFSPGGNDRKTQSLQERYVQTKAAAEKYQVLQVGLTICHEDTKTGVYHTSWEMGGCHEIVLNYCPTFAQPSS